MSREGQRAMEAFLGAGGAIKICQPCATGVRLPHYDDAQDIKIKARMSAASKAGASRALQARTPTSMSRRDKVYAKMVV